MTHTEWVPIRIGADSPVVGLLTTSMLASLLTAFSFLTILPLPTRRETSLVDLGRAVGWFPLPGLVIGAVLAGLDWGLGRAFPPGITAVLVLAAWLLASGAIHFDGFLGSRHVAECPRANSFERLFTDDGATEGGLIEQVREESLPSFLSASTNRPEAVGYHLLDQLQ